MRRASSRSIRGTRCSGRNADGATACRSCSSTGALAAAACRITAVSTTRRTGGSSCSTSAVPAGRRRRPTSPTTRPGTWCRTSSGCARILGSSAGRCSAVRGVRRSRSPMRRRIRNAAWAWCCAASSSPRPRRSTGSCTAWATSFRRPGGRSRNSCRKGNATTCSRTTTRASSIPIPPSTCRPRTPGTSTKAPAPRCCRGPIPGPRSSNDATALAIARIEAHYFVHRAFLSDDELIGNLHRVRHLPATIVQGRYDVVCPPATAADLARGWPEAEFVIVPDAGHSVREPGIARELVAAVERLKARLAAQA